MRVNSVNLKSTSVVYVDMPYISTVFQLLSRRGFSLCTDCALDISFRVSSEQVIGFLSAYDLTCTTYRWVFTCKS